MGGGKQLGAGPEQLATPQLLPEPVSTALSPQQSSFVAQLQNALGGFLAAPPGGEGSLVVTSPADPNPTAPRRPTSLTIPITPGQPGLLARGAK